jgi:hypothetical protein
MGSKDIHAAHRLALFICLVISVCHLVVRGCGRGLTQKMTSHLVVRD